MTKEQEASITARVKALRALGLTIDVRATIRIALRGEQMKLRAIRESGDFSPINQSYREQRVKDALDAMSKL